MATIKTFLVSQRNFSLRKLFALCVVMVSFQTLKAQVNVYSNQTALTLAQTLTGPGVTISNATLVCPTNANGLFGVVSSNLNLDSGIVLTSGTAQTSGSIYGVNGSPSNTAATGNNAAGDGALDTLAGDPTHDACKLEFDFVPAGDTIKFDYVFGSDEYPTYNCSFNDVFGFFISGPGITGQKNIATIPGTANIPVGISTINNGAGYVASAGNKCYDRTNGNGPYTSYYVTNTGTSITYNGFTVVLQAISPVTPCSTYHLKLAIADALDYTLDSGVFLKAGSLTSNAISIKPVGGGGLVAPTPYCVRGCAPGQFVFTRPQAKPTPLTIHYQIQGSAVNGTDYTFIPDSVVIPANGTTALRQIFALPANPATGPKIVKLRVYSPYTCGANTPIIDSAFMTIYDSLQAKILTPDTAVCRYQSVNILTEGDTLLTFNWTPSMGLNNPNSRTPVATPLTTTTYTLNASLPGSGCPVTHKNITITIKQPPVVDAGPDRTTCLGTPFQFNVVTTPANQSYSYSWTTGANLSSTTIANPVFTPSAVINNITYYITANPGAVGCSGYDTVNVRVIPDDFTLSTPDTAICQGASIQIQANGDTVHKYHWSPSFGVNDTSILTPLITPDTSRKYLVTASYPGCPDIIKSIYADVQPNPIVFVGNDREKCQWDTIQVNPIINPAWYNKYSYDWSPKNGIDYPNVADIVFSGQKDTTLKLTVTTPAGCKGSDDLSVVVHKGNFATLNPSPDTAICPRDTVYMHATGGVNYHWTPGVFINDTNSSDPVVYPITNTVYTAMVTDQFGCFDTLSLGVTVHPNAVLDLGDTIVLYPGENIQMNPKGNCLYFQWFPALGLSATNIPNPIAMPEVNTKYIVNATTEASCPAIDSVVVIVNPESVIDVPNAFAPSGQDNRILKINKRGLASLKYFRIFNRWGAKVFETSNLEEGWDGNLNGAIQPMGVYIYMVEAYTNTGRRVYKQGNVTLIR